MARSRSSKQIIGRIERAHRGFSDAAVRRLYPELQGEDLVRAVARESALSSDYLGNMRRRIVVGERAIRSDTTLEDLEQMDRRQALERLERGYLRKHLEARARRLGTEADISRLKSQGEDGAYWWLDPDVKTRHCDSCLLMGGRWWPFSVLDQVNPATEHAGCKCKLIAGSVARARGLDVRRGYRTSAIRAKLREAASQHIAGDVIKVPLPPGKEGNPYHDSHGRFSHSPFVRVPGVPGQGISRAVRKPLGRYFDAIKAGDRDAMDRHFEDSVKATRAIKDRPRRDENLRALGRIRAAAMNPGGVRAPVGARHAGAGVPQSVHEGHGSNTTPWGEKGNFAWLVRPAALGKSHERVAAALRKSGDFDVRVHPDGLQLETKPSLDPVYALAAARELEIMSPGLRNNRLAGDHDALGVNTPLDLHPSEVPGDVPAEERPRYGRRMQSRYPLVAWDQLGKAAEAMAPETRDRLADLGLVRSNARVHTPGLRQTGRGRSGKESELDWEIGPYGIEVKSESMRGMSTFLAREGSSKIKWDQRAKKQAAAAARSKRPALVHSVVDLDDDVAHLFFHEYGPDEKPFASRRLPQDLRRRLMDGDLKPGDAAAGAHGSDVGKEGNETIYLGSFRLPYNPLRTSRLGDERVEPGHSPEMESLEHLEDRQTAGRAADIGVGDRKAPEVVTTPAKTVADEAQAASKAVKQSRDERIVSLFTGDPPKSQSQIAREIGLSQPGVRKILLQRLGADALSKRGKAGTRHDLRKGARRVAESDSDLAGSPEMETVR
jgi:hypothetical protein